MRKPYDKRLNVWLDPKTKEQIKEIAEEEGRTISEIVRELFVKYIEKKKRKKWKLPSKRRTLTLTKS